ncbi:hypothetical protein FA15DRAFT_687291 [Coprinopsis marcescibilis]|uniref:UBC core domain-containing protein n=1 Tax=Coprinopsis marcescibilis TaxID=230819 RepID=A0A5C3KX81_COPMA|nr:hypothetical protein FA15DRAFT_687291 [Coprinopsis marcescibilis]
MSTNGSHRLLSRLHRDLTELLAQPYPGVSIFLNEENIREFCLVLTPPSGPWTGLNLHFDVILPDQWPTIPPQVSSSVYGIQHPNLFGEYICCDLLKRDSELQHGYTGGYTPALTLRGLFLQFLTFFSSTRVEQDYGGIIEIGDLHIVSYVQEQVLGERLDPDSSLHHHHHHHAPGHSQISSERLWNNDPAEPTVLSVYATSGSKITDEVKSSTPHPERVHKISRLNPRWQSTLDSICRWTCSRCPYGSMQLPHNSLSKVERGTGDAIVASLPYMNPPTICPLGQVDEDVLLELANAMPSESVITFGRAYPRFYDLISAHHVLLQRELRCFFLKTPLQEGILGVGVAFDHGPRSLSSDFDWLSLEAFSTHNVRKSVQKRQFEYFLPLAFNKYHFERAQPEIWKRLTEIDLIVKQVDRETKTRVQNGNGNGRGRGGFAGRGRVPPRAGQTDACVPPPGKAHQVVDVLYRMMNNIVVALMKSCDDALEASTRSSTKAGLLTASEKAIISYCHLMHLLICLCRTHPVVLQDAKARLQAFIKSPDNRTKAVEPDMGQLVVLMTLVLIMTPPNQANGPSWAIMNGPFLEEAITRNARWVLKDAPELEVMEEGASDYRLEVTFSKSKTSLRLLMFQSTFLDLFIKTYHQLGIKALDENYGFPTKELPEKMVEEIKDVYKVANWPDFFAKVRFGKGAAFTKETFTGMLRDAIQKSQKRGYHKPAPWGRLQDLGHVRKSLERARAEAKTRK